MQKNTLLKNKNGWKTILDFDITKMSICFRIGTLCNLNCSYCISSSSPEGLMPRYGYINVFEEIVRYSPKRVILTGGEPFLYKNIRKFIEIPVKKGIRTKIGTNGTINFKNFGWLKKVNYNLIKIDISLHSVDTLFISPITGETCRSILFSNMKFLSSLGITFTANIPLIKISLKKYNKCINELLTFGAERIKLTRIFKIGRGKNKKNNLYLSPSQEEQISKELKQHFGEKILEPLESLEKLINGTILVDENINVCIGGKKLIELPYEEVMMSLRLNNELYK